MLKFPIYLPKEAVKLSVWNGSVHSWFGIEGKTIIQINVDSQHILTEFTFDTDHFSMADFDECKFLLGGRYHK